MALFTDDFIRADANLEASGSWTHDGLIAGAAAIRSNQLACLTTNATGSAYKAPAVGSSDHFVEYTTRFTGSSGPFVACRLTDRSNFVGIRNDGGVLEVYRRVGGTLTSLYTGSQTIVSGTVLRLECEGTNWRAFKNGVQVASGAIGNASLTSGDAGVVMRTSTANPFIDDFSTGTLGAAAFGAASANQALTLGQIAEAAVAVCASAEQAFSLGSSGTASVPISAVADQALAFASVGGGNVRIAASADQSMAVAGSAEVALAIAIEAFADQGFAFAQEAFGEVRISAFAEQGFLFEQRFASPETALGDVIRLAGSVVERAALAGSLADPVRLRGAVHRTVSLRGAL